MKNLKYHIFKVYDYKGGELSTSINLSKERFVGEIIEYFIDYDEIEFNQGTPDILKLSKDIVRNIKELSKYACGDSQVAEFFSTDDESLELTSVNLEKFVRDNILDVVKQYCEIEDYKLTEDDIASLTK